MKLRSWRNGIAAVGVILRNYFGNGWPWWLLLIATITFTPAWYFRNQIALAPEKFVEEWIKMIVTTLLVAVVVELIVARREKAEALEHERGGLRRDYIHRFDRMIGSLQQLKDADAADLKAQDSMVAKIHRDWKEFRDRYHNDFVMSGPAHLEDYHVERIREVDVSAADHLVDAALMADPQDKGDCCESAIAELAAIKTVFVDAENSEN